MYRENFERDLFILSIKFNASIQILFKPYDIFMYIISDSIILYEYYNMIID